MNQEISFLRYYRIQSRFSLSETGLGKQRLVCEVAINFDADYYKFYLQNSSYMPLEYEWFATLHHNIFPTGRKSPRLLLRGMNFLLSILFLLSCRLNLPGRGIDNHRLNNRNQHWGDGLPMPSNCAPATPTTANQQPPSMWPGDTRHPIAQHYDQQKGEE